MVNKIDKEEFRFIEVAFIQKTNLRHVTPIDVDGKDSLKHLQNIIESTKPMLKTLCLEHNNVQLSYQSVTNVISGGKKILEFHFVWARMILELYYFYHETKEEALKIVDAMISFEGFGYIKEAVQEGVRLIDDYYEKEWTENIADTPRTKKPQNVISQIRQDTMEMFSEEIKEPQEKQLSQNPNILQVMQDINSGKLRYYEVD